MNDKFLQRPDCTCFKPEKNGHGDTAADFIAGNTYEAFRALMNESHICKKAALYILLRTIVFMTDVVCYNICDRDDDKSDEAREKFFAELPQRAKLIIQEFDAAIEAQGKPLQ